MLYLPTFCQLDQHMFVFTDVLGSDRSFLAVVNVSGCYSWRKSLPGSVVSELSFCLF